jgi:hypothetical protein
VENELNVVDHSQKPIVDALHLETEARVRDSKQTIRDQESFIATTKAMRMLDAREYSPSYNPPSPEITPEVTRMSEELERLRLEQETSYPKLDSLRAEWAGVKARRLSRAPPAVNPTFTPPASNLPAVDPPAVDPPAVNPPVFNPPAFSPPGFNPPPLASTPPPPKRPLNLPDDTDPNTRRRSNHPQRPSAGEFPVWLESLDWRSPQTGGDTQAGDSGVPEETGVPEWLARKSWRRERAPTSELSYAQFTRQNQSQGSRQSTEDPDFTGAQSQGSRQPRQDTEDLESSFDFRGMMDDTADAPENPENPENPEDPENPKNPKNPRNPKNPKNPKGRGRPAKDRPDVDYPRFLAIPGQPIASINTLPQEVADALNTSLDNMLDENQTASRRVTDPDNAAKYVNSDLCVGQHIFAKGKGKPKTPDVADSGCAACARNNRPCVELRRAQDSEEVVFVFYPQHKDYTDVEDITDSEYWL